MPCSYLLLGNATLVGGSRGKVSHERRRSRRCEFPCRYYPRFIAGNLCRFEERPSNFPVGADTKLSITRFAPARECGRSSRGVADGAGCRIRFDHSDNVLFEFRVVVPLCVGASGTVPQQRKVSEPETTWDKQDDVRLVTVFFLNGQHCGDNHPDGDEKEQPHDRCLDQNA